MLPLGAQADVIGFPGDLLALTVLVFALFLFGIAGGQRFSVAFLVGLYVAQAFVTTFGSLRVFLLKLGLALPAQATALLFLLAVAFTTWLLAGSAVTALFRFSGKGLRSWWQIGVASVLGTGLFAALFFPLLPRGTFTPSASLAQWILVDPFPFLWTLAPVIFFVVLRAEEE